MEGGSLEGDHNAKVVSGKKLEARLENVID